MAGRPRKTTDGMTITGEEKSPETPETESQTPSVENSEAEAPKLDPGLQYRAFHSDVVMDTPYSIHNGQVGHRVRVTYGDGEIFNETGFDRSGLEQEARDAIRLHRATNFPEGEKEFDLDW